VNFLYVAHLLSKYPIKNDKSVINRIDAFCIWGTRQFEAINKYSQEQISKFDNFILEETKRIIYLNFYLLNAERYDNTEALLYSLLKADPDDQYVREQLARLAAFRSDRGKEIEFRKEIEQIDPLNYTNLLSLAEVLDINGNIVEAKSYAQRVIEITSNEDFEKRAQDILGK
jgi:hypothetical protein